MYKRQYHDNPEDADWIRNNIDRIAANIVQSLTQYFGLPFIDNPQPPRQGTVQTQGGNLNIRARPSRDAQVIGQAPNGATVTINGEWQGWDVISYNGIVGYVDSSYIV